MAGSVREGECLLSYLACRVKTSPTLNMYSAFVAFYTAKAIPSRGVLWPCKHGVPAWKVTRQACKCFDVFAKEMYVKLAHPK